LYEINDDLSVESGNSKLYNQIEKGLENIKIDKNDFDTIFLLFLPQFLMETPFHLLLLKEKYDTFNTIVNQIDNKLFEAFFNHEENLYVKKITNMFIYILENVQSFYLGAIDEYYCELFIDCDDEDESEIDPKTFENKKKIEIFLKQIKDFTLKDTTFRNCQEIN
jgi:succinate dehydrogenase flavin-adding protein (antitoxin of CptAB toxin-antitoxin module)